MRSGMNETLTSERSTPNHLNQSATESKNTMSNEATPIATAHDLRCEFCSGPVHLTGYSSDPDWCNGSNGEDSWGLVLCRDAECSRHWGNMTPLERLAIYKSNARKRTAEAAKLAADVGTLPGGPE